MNGETKYFRPIVLPVEGDETLRVCGYRDGRGVRIARDPTGFISAHLFRAAYRRATPDGITISGGRVSIYACGNAADSNVEMEVEIDLDDEMVRLDFETDVVDELIEHVSMAEALLRRYDVDSTKNTGRGRADTKAADRNIAPAARDRCMSGSSNGHDL